MADARDERGPVASPTGEPTGSATGSLAFLDGIDLSSLTGDGPAPGFQLMTLDAYEARGY